MANLNRARALIVEGQLEQAREIIVEALHDNYDNADAWWLLTQCSRDRQEYARALREILRIEPENADARRLTVELAKQSSGKSSELPPQADEDAPSRPRRRRRSSPLATLVRFMLNLLAFGVVVAIAGGIAYLYLEWQETDTPEDNTVVVVPTLDPAQKCVEDTALVYERLPARCPLVTTGQACLINPSTIVESNTGQTDLLTLAGDNAPLDTLISLETFSYNPQDYTWGMVVMRGLASFEEGTTQDGVLMVVTSGVRLRFFDDALRQITFSSNPVVSTCSATPPAGLLVHVSPAESAAFEVNGESLIVSGTIFLQVDAAAGMKVIVLNGQVALVERNTEIVGGQWAQLDVNSSLLTVDTTVEVFESDPNLRGNVANLVPLGQAFNLATETWRVTGLNSPNSTGTVE